MTETPLLREIMLRLCQAFPFVRVFRNNTGMGWTGQSARTPNGSMIISNPRPLHAGLTKGSSDLIGWTTVEITPDMVGRKLAVFTAIEVKTAKGRTSDEQANFIQVVQGAGGIAFVTKSPDDAVNALKILAPSGSK